MVVLLAFAESKTASTTTLGLDFPTVWDQTPHRFGLFYWLFYWTLSGTLLSHMWNVIGFFRSCVCPYCHWFFFVTCTLLREISNRRSRLSICLESLSPTSSTSSHASLSGSVLEYLGLGCCLGLCDWALCFSPYVPILHPPTRM